MGLTKVLQWLQHVEIFESNYFICALAWLDLKISYIFKDWIILEERGFRGGSDEISKKMWHRREIVVAGLPPFPLSVLNFIICLKATVYRV